VSRFALVFWSVVAACGIAAIVAGMVGNARIASHKAAARATTIAATTSHPTPTPIPHPSTASFGNDWDVVVDRGSSPNADGSARVAVVVGPCGTDPAIDAAFARMDVPIGIVIDPKGNDAVAAAALARSQRKPFYLQIGGVPSPAAIGSLLKRFDGAAGFASPAGRGMATALAGTGLAYVDELGDADPAAFAKAGTPLIRRDLTVDDRDAAGFVSFMLERAVVLGAARGRAVAWMRPRASSLQALRAFANQHAPDLVAFGP
jgi:hypothetical protein